MKFPDKTVEGDKQDWDHAARKSNQSWNNPPDGGKDQTPDEQMDRMREGYGIGKDGADPAHDEAGQHPDKPGS